MILRIPTKVMFTFLVLLWSMEAISQELPDAPQPQSTCGPAWLGGCFVAPKRSFSSVFSDRKWQLSTGGFLLSKVFDAEMTHAKVSHQCIEGNGDLPAFPSRGELYREMLFKEVPVIVLGTLITKTVPEHPKTKVQKFASWIYPAMASYGTVQHIRGGVGWMSCP